VKTNPHNNKDVGRGKTATPGSVKPYNKTAKPELVAITIADLVAGFAHFRLSEQWISPILTQLDQNSKRQREPDTPTTTKAITARHESDTDRS